MQEEKLSDIGESTITFQWRKKTSVRCRRKRKKNFPEMCFSSPIFHRYLQFRCRNHQVVKNLADFKRFTVFLWLDLKLDRGTYNTDSRKWRFWWHGRRKFFLSSHSDSIFCISSKIMAVGNLGRKERHSGLESADYSLKKYAIQNSISF